MSTSTSTTPKGVLPAEVDGVPIIYSRGKQGFFVPEKGPAVAVIYRKTKLYDEDDGKLATANMAIIVAYHDGEEAGEYYLRTTRWYSGKLRWHIIQRIKARIRRAVKLIT